jgi:hypothetical protein
MFVHAVAGVDDAAAADAGQLVRGSRRGVPQDDHVGCHRLERPRGVGQRLALGDARPGRGHAERVGAEPLFGQLERHACPRAGLEEQVDDRPPAQGRHLLNRPERHFLHGGGRLHDEVDFVRLQLVDAEQMTAP